jgi:hypothetical protein
MHGMLETQKINDRSRTDPCTMHATPADLVSCSTRARWVQAACTLLVHVRIAFEMRSVLTSIACTAFPRRPSPGRR